MERGISDEVLVGDTKESDEGLVDSDQSDLNSYDRWKGGEDSNSDDVEDKESNLDKEVDVSKNKDKSVCKRILRKGRDIHNPVAGAEATISFYLQSTPSDVTEITYCVGDPGSQVPVVLDLALRHMNTNELSQITIYKDEKLGASSESPMIFELTLKSFEKFKHLSSISPFSDQISYMKMLKEKANNFLKNSNYDSAIELYGRIEDDSQYILANGPNEQSELDEGIIAVRLNLALVYLKLGNGKKCIEFCEKVLNASADNEKALFRIGQAHLLRYDHEEAIVYFNKALQKNPENTAAAKQVQICTVAIKRVHERERKMCHNIFNRYKDIGLGGDENQLIEEQSTA